MDYAKIKFEQRTCYGCLSTDRKTTTLGDLCEMYEMLLPTARHTITYICWECKSILRKLYRFQKQIQHAQESLTYQTSCFNSLSNLTMNYKDNCDREITFDYDIFHQVDLKENYIAIKEENTNDVAEIDIKDNVTTTHNHITIDHETYSEDNDLCYDLNLDTEPTDTSDITQKTEKKLKKKKSLNTKEEASSTKRKLKNWKNIKLEYKSYANIVTTDGWDKPHSQYFKQVHLDESDMESCFLMNERKRKRDLPLQCEICLLTYSRQIDLDRHTNLNHYKPNPPYSCLHCATTHSSLARLARHWRSHSTFYACTLCGARVFRCSLSLHLGRCHRRQYRCTHCCTRASSLAAFIEHCSKSHPFICDYCSKKCALRSVLEKHIKNHHTPHRCAPCARSFPSRRAHRAHVRERHPRALGAPAPPDHRYCVECDAQFVSVALYKRHVSAKHAPNKAKVKKVSCPDCGKAFTKYSDMMLHYNFAHVKVTKYHCDLCDKYFLKMFGLRTHMERVHLKLPTPKNKICDLCGRAFQSKSVLENHRRTHTGERPFKCGACPAAFAQKGAMRIHQRKQHAT